MDFYTEKELKSLNYSEIPIEAGHIYLHAGGMNLVVPLVPGTFAHNYPRIATSKIVLNGWTYHSILSYRLEGKIVKWCDYKIVDKEVFPVMTEKSYSLIFGTQKIKPALKIYTPMIRKPGLFWVPRITWRKIKPTMRVGFEDLKKTMNREKKNIETVPENYYRHASIALRDHADLLGRNSLLKKYTSTKVTNAWLKFYECINFLQKEYLILPLTDLKSLHVAEAPGNFVSALHHFLRTNLPSEYTWDWKANTYEGEVGNMGYLDDALGLIKKYRNKWLLGPTGDGDITHPDNIKEFSKQKYHLVTSDVKVVDTKNPNYDEEENINAAVQLGHVLIAIESLLPGGTAVLKHFTLYESFSHDLVAILSQCFERVFVYKPKTSKAANSEVYLVGIRFQGKIPTEDLYKILEQYRSAQNGTEKIAIYERLPDYFIQRLYQIEEEITLEQMRELSKTIDRAKKCEKIGPRAMRELEEKRIEMTSREWIEQTGITALDNPL